MNKIVSDYVDIEFTKAHSKRVVEATDEENHYASVVVSDPIQLLDKEKLYRVNCDHTAKQPNGKPTQIKLGDIFLGESESLGQVFGTLLQKAGGTPKKLHLEIVKLQLYERAVLSTNNSNKDEESYDDEDANLYVNKDELILTKTDRQNSTSHPVVAAKPLFMAQNSIASVESLQDLKKCDKELANSIGLDIGDIKDSTLPPADKWKSIKEDKIPNSEAECDNVIPVFAITDFKKSKKPNRLIFKKYQTGKLLYSTEKWWFISVGDLKGWSPYHYWRIVPEIKSDDISLPDYQPWDKTSIPIEEINKYFETAREKEFAMKVIKGDKVDDRVEVWVKEGQTKKFSISMNPSNGHVTSWNSQVFQSIHNFVIYHKKNPLPSTQSLTLGRPMKKN